jgi:hypothetical protein
MKKKISDWLSNWLAETEEEWNEMTYSVYQKDILFIHILYKHAWNYKWRDVYVFLGWRIKLFSYTTGMRL